MSHTNPEASDLPRAVHLDLTKTQSISGRARPPLALIDSSTGKRLGPRAVNNQAGAPQHRPVERVIRHGLPPPPRACHM